MFSHHQQHLKNRAIILSHAIILATTAIALLQRGINKLVLFDFLLI